MIVWTLNKEGESRDWQTKNLNHWAMYLTLQRGKIGMLSLISTLLFDCIGQATSPRS
jgi:hypothetical protein